MGYMGISEPRSIYLRAATYRDYKGSLWIPEYIGFRDLGIWGLGI